MSRSSGVLAILDLELAFCPDVLTQHRPDATAMYCLPFTECPYAQGFVGRAFCRRGEDRAGAGQSQHPQACLALRSLPRRRGAPVRRAFRMALHAQCFESLSRAVDSTWPTPNSACSRRSVWVAASLTYTSVAMPNVVQPEVVVRFPASWRTTWRPCS